MVRQKEFVGPLEIDFHSIWAKTSRWHTRGDLSPNEHQLDCIAKPGHEIRWTVKDRNLITLSTHKTLDSAIKSLIKAGKNLNLPVDLTMADMYKAALAKEKEKTDVHDDKDTPAV